MTAIIYFFVGAAVTAVLSALAATVLRRKAVAQAEQTMHDRTAAEYQSTQARLEAERDNALKQVEDVKADMQQRIEQEQTRAKEHQQELLGALEKRHQEALNAQQERFNETMAKVSAQVKNATDEMLKQRQEEMQKANNANMSQIVGPLKETIQKMEEAIKENKSTQETSTEAIKEKIATLVSTTMKVSDSADRLSNALTAENKTQGNWGEQKIESLLNAIGLEEGLEYDRQEYLRDATGSIIVSDETASRMQPDIILHLDENRDLIIDSKVSLNAYVDYTNADSDGARSVALGQHLKSVRAHVKELAKKNYSAYVKAPRRSVDFVMMFVPVDGALQLALGSDATLWREAMNQGVFIVGEQNLYAALRAVQVTWTSIKQNANNKEICDTAEELLNRVGDFLERFQEVGERLDKLQKSYEAANKKATEGQSILGSAHKLVKLGAKVSNVHPLPPLAE